MGRLIERSTFFGFVRENARWLAGGFLLTYFSSFGQTFFISASVAEWQAAFALSHGGFGLLYLLATLGSALCLPWVGRLVGVALLCAGAWVAMGYAV